MEKVFFPTYHQVINQTFCDKLKSDNYTGLVLGAEFCGRLFPNLQVIRKIQHFCQNNGLRFSLITPPLFELEFQNITDIVLSLSNNLEEIIINDLGLLRFLTKQKITSKLTLGRALFHLAESEDTLKLFPEITKCQMDSLNELTDITLPISFFSQWQYLQTGRFCTIAATLGKMNYDTSSCGQQCVKHSYKITNSLMNQEIFYQGNTAYQKLDSQSINKKLCRFSQIKEIVIQQF